MQADPPNAMEGFPDDGDEFEEAAPPAPAPEPPAPPADSNADLRARLDRLERENESMRRLIPPAAPKPPPVPNPAAQDDFDSVDWDRELFANPKEALRKAVKIATDTTTKQLRSEYQRDKGTREFWDKFYGKHPDLRDDHDLVEVTLNSNLADLANIPVEDVYGKLAELTRQRILRYAGGAARKTTPKARAEGAGGTPVTPAPAAPAPRSEVTSISAFIRERRQRRRAGAA